MKIFGLMAAIGKIELDNFRERATMGKRGTAKQGRIPSGLLPYGYRIGANGKPAVVEAEAEIVRRIFRQYVYEGLGVPSITRQLRGRRSPHGKAKRQALVRFADQSHPEKSGLQEHVGPMAEAGTFRPRTGE